ncbi:copper chaperone PCu(A)C [Thioalkalivibrio sp. ALJ1]|uniref:copper chaperone PCu(A)C n=1 Tax=Thioalkalivibrio sp. ALJ1 TaxID=1158144 RepID=UPI00056E7889|nr:copper chaperone PCu(A)C [Thioalkalivibrio sp. ALJ1]
MNTRLAQPSIRLTVACLVLAGLFAVTTSTHAHHVDGHDEPGFCDCMEGVEIDDRPWVRLMPSGMPSTAAYMTLRNTTDEDIEIVSGSSPVAAVTELHDHEEDEAGVMRMREVEAIIIPAKRSVSLEPGGLHVMLIDLKEPLAEGQEVRVKLHTRTGELFTVKAEVKRSDEHQPGGHHHHEGDHHQH